MDKLLHPVPDGAACLGISERKFWELIRRGEVRTVLIGRRRLVSTEALREYADRLDSAA